MDSSRRGGPVRVLALTGHPVEAAGARYRVVQFIPGLEQLGFQIDHRPFFTRDEFAALYRPFAPAKLAALLRGTARRSVDLVRSGQYDLLWIHIWLHPFTFPPFDLALRLLDIPIVFDFDDAYWSVGSASDWLRDPGWAPRLMRRAHTVVAGSDYIRERVKAHNPRVEVLPTCIDTDRFAPRDFANERNPIPVIGWVGSHSTFPFLEGIFPVLERLARDHDFVLRVVGAQREVPIPGVTIDYQPWTLEREVEHFRELDIGLYPLKDTEIARGKHGFKLHQYMSVGVPTVASALGLNPDMVEHGENAFLAATPEQWHDALSRLLRDEALRRRVGGASRAHIVETASVRACTPPLARILGEAAASRPARRRIP